MFTKVASMLITKEKRQATGLKIALLLEREKNTKKLYKPVALSDEQLELIPLKKAQAKENP